ncbi:MAG TPA: ABC transporter ATP-binding protein [Acidobacteriaceae bacterium]|nr:ABC transporter ATP-binding protein [Acidobacteriaceae bacterium]
MEPFSPTSPASNQAMVTALHRPEAGEHLTKQKSEGPALIQVRSLRKEYVTGRGRLVLFDGLSFDVAEGEMLAIVGESGAGKSTLLHILGALDTPSCGDVYCASIQLKNLSSKEAARFRNREVGYVWQFHYLLPEFTAAENVAMPLLARGERKAAALLKAAEWLEEVELGDRAEHRAGELSGGEQQRVSLARALVTGPKVLLADEPTGDLDSRTSGVVFDLVERLHQNHHLTSIIVTHNMALAERCSRILRLEKGRLQDVSPLASSAGG